MTLYKTRIKTFTILLFSILLMSCSGQDGSSDNGADPVVSVSSKPTVTLLSEQVTVNLGEIFTLDITMSNFPTSEGGGVTVQFDPSMLNASHVAINSEVWNFVNKTGEIDNKAGLISDILFSNFAGISGDTKVATITFNTITAGNSQISLEGSSINPFSSNGSKVVANFVSTDVEIIDSVGM